MQEQQRSAVPPSTRAGHVALVGRPNAGKSTLLNAFVGEKLSIVTPRAQTTREQVLGILSTETAQIVFVDTPGLLEPKYRLQQSMLESAMAAVVDADVVLLLMDATRPTELPPAGVMTRLRLRRDQLICALNKADVAAPEALKVLKQWCRQELGGEAIACSALTGLGVEELLDHVVKRLPESPFLYPAGDLAVQPVRFFVEELIRETVFEQYDEEVPYGTVVRIEEFRENQQPVYIRATVFVERNSQKPIILGKRGEAIRALGQAARTKIESFLGSSVFLDLWVKPLPGWRNKPSALKFLGFRISPDDHQP
jgi:GTP-binding protein Era